MNELNFHLEQAKEQRCVALDEQQKIISLGHDIREKRQKRFDEVMAKNEVMRKKYDYLQRIHFCENQILHALHRLSLIKDELEHLHIQIENIKNQLSHDDSKQQGFLDQILLCQQEEQSLLAEQDSLQTDIDANKAILEQSKQRLKAAESAIKLSEQILSQHDQTIAALEDKRSHHHQCMKTALSMAEHHEQLIKQLKQHLPVGTGDGISVVSKGLSSNLTADELRAQIREHDQQAKAADTQMRDALKQRNQTEAERFRQIRDHHNQQSRDLSKALQTLNKPSTQTNNKKPETGTENDLSTDELKQKIRHHNQQAVIADGKMRAALEDGMHNEASDWRVERDRHNQFAAQYQSLLLQASSTHKKSKVDAQDCRIEHLAAEFASNLQKYAKSPDIAQDPSHDRLITCLLSAKSYGFSTDYCDAMIKSVNGQRYNIQKQSDVNQLQQTLSKNAEGRFIVEPFIRDAFKLTLSTDDKTPLNFDNFDISDRIADNDFRADFDASVHKINRYVKNQLGNPNAAQLKTFNQVAHRDAIQVIPRPTEQFGWRDHFLGIAVQRPISIANNRIQSSLSLQGIFASDGAFKNLSICDNQIDIKGGHTISIAGVLSGRFENNCDLDGNPLPDHDTKLLPIRLGGWSNIFITGFHPDSEYRYHTTNIPPECDFRDRPSRFNKRGHASFYNHVHMERFHNEYAQLQHASSIMDELEQQKRAVDEGKQDGIPNMPLMYYCIKFVLSSLVQRGFAKEDLRRL